MWSITWINCLLKINRPVNMQVLNYLRFGWMVVKVYQTFCQPVINAGVQVALITVLQVCSVKNFISLWADCVPVVQVSVLVMCHTRELAFQISKEYERFSKYMPTVKVAVFFGGMSIKKDEDVLKKSCPHIVVGTPGRILALVRNKTLNLKNVKHFVLDECDKMLEQLGEHLEEVRLMCVCQTDSLTIHVCFCVRYEAWRSGHLQTDASWEAVHDVQRHPQQRDTPRLPQVHAGREWRLSVLVRLPCFGDLFCSRGERLCSSFLKWFKCCFCPYSFRYVIVVLISANFQGNFFIFI